MLYWNPTAYANHALLMFSVPCHIYTVYVYQPKKAHSLLWFSVLPALPQHPQDAREPSESPAVPIERENDAPYAPNGYGYQRGWWFQTWLSLPMFIQKWGLSQARRQL